jgi:peptidoglycan/LPS O-acetylase OafA/YrhL
VTRIPTLDGWRGFAIAMVLFDHIQYAATGGYLRPWTQTGRHGVTIFFVLSGFLITSNLVAEPIDLKKFYIRRLFRLMPPAWTYLAAVLITGSLTRFHLTSWVEVKACLLFYRNFCGPLQPNAAGHFWSLSIEEQFYLVWPCLLLLIGARRCRWIAGAAAVGIAFFRWHMWQHYQDSLLANRTEVRADALFVGCLLALLLSSQTIRARASLWSKWATLPAAVGLLLAIVNFHLLQPLWESACIAVLLAATMHHSDSAVSLALSWKPFAWLGTISYSLYLWNAPFMGLNASPLMLMLSVGFAFPLFTLGSYYLIERPTTGFGRRLTTARASNPTDLDSTLVPAFRTAADHEDSRQAPTSPTQFESGIPVSASLDPGIPQ